MKYWLSPEEEKELLDEYNINNPRCFHCEDRFKKDELIQLSEHLLYCDNCFEKLK